jgi:succinyl-diaminopimelate desuccinylase
VSPTPVTVPAALDLHSSADDLTAALVDIPSVSGAEGPIADLIEAALRAEQRFQVERAGNSVLARTNLGLPTRVLLAGHIDTVPIADNVPSRPDGDSLHGCGTADMKSGVAGMLRLRHHVGAGALRPRVDLTWVYYDCEEIEAVHNGLGRLARDRPDTLHGDLAILLEPTDGLVEGGCQGSMRAVVRTSGVRAHSARSWLGENAIHRAAPILQRLAEYQGREVEVDGLAYREGLNAVGISGGVAGNIVPDECLVTVNFRFAPDRDEAQAAEHVSQVFAGFPVEVVDSAPAARPGLDAELPRSVVDAVGVPARAKLGWTDVARFGQLGIPAVNLGPGDPTLAHKPEEHVSLAKVRATEDALVRFLR